MVPIDIGTLPNRKMLPWSAYGQGKGISALTHECVIYEVYPMAAAKTNHFHSSVPGTLHPAQDIP